LPGSLPRAAAERRHTNCVDLHNRRALAIRCGAAARPSHGARRTSGGRQGQRPHPTATIRE
jgi:hypothetical protein